MLRLLRKVSKRGRVRLRSRSSPKSPGWRGPTLSQADGLNPWGAKHPASVQGGRSIAMTTTDRLGRGAGPSGKATCWPPIGLRAGMLVLRTGARTAVRCWALDARRRLQTRESERPSVPRRDHVIVLRTLPKMSHEKVTRSVVTVTLGCTRDYFSSSKRNKKIRNTGCSSERNLHKCPPSTVATNFIAPLTPETPGRVKRSAGSKLCPQQPPPWLR